MTLIVQSAYCQARVLWVLKLHVFFDDQLTHLKPAAGEAPSVHVSFEVVNKLILFNYWASKASTGRGFPERLPWGQKLV